jgi:predicted metal-dependent hydrolase
MRMRVMPDGSVRITVPRRTAVAHAVEFAQSHIEWIRQQQKTARERTVIFTAGAPIKTRCHEITVSHHALNTCRIVRDGAAIHILLPENADITTAAIQQKIKTIVEEVMRSEALNYLPVRMNELALAFGLTFGRITVKNIKTRWGSCSAVNNINLNLHLMQLPDRLIDYVLLHELAHVKEKNHSQRFWDFLEEICPNARQLDKELKQYHCS